MRDFIGFKAACKKQMTEYHWTNNDLAKATGYSIGAIERFMGEKDTRPKSEAVALAIAKALNIPEHMAT